MLFKYIRNAVQAYMLKHQKPEKPRKDICEIDNLNLYEVKCLAGYLELLPEDDILRTLKNSLRICIEMEERCRIGYR